MRREYSVTYMGLKFRQARLIHGVWYFYDILSSDYKAFTFQHRVKHPVPLNARQRIATGHKSMQISMPEASLFSLPSLNP